MAPLAEKISGWVDMGARVVLVCRTEQQANRLREILENYRVTVDEVVNHWGEVSRGRGLSLCLGRLTKGFSWPDLGLFVISEDQLFGPKRGRAGSRRQAGAGDLGWTSFSQLKEGDLVVHQDHGIGQYGGLCKMEIEEKVNDFVIIDYAQSDRLYLPADRISFLQKYVGADESNPRLDQLGGRSWKVAKEKAKKSVKEIAKQLVEIYALRKHRKGYAFSLPDNFYREFEATFEHEETQDQVKAIDDILEDMGRELPMDRLICGDVGFGKTEVALRAAFKAVTDGKQVAMLVPTTVLAEQHYETFRGRMAPFGMEVGVLSRFKRQAEQKEIIAKVRSGKIDVIIGTHRILQKDMGFRDLGLLIIDEEQRFGVKQKEVLKKYRALVDVLALTATPIPRTLHMSFMGIRDLSIIETPPEDRLAIKTYLTTFDEATIVRAIETEIARGGQVFFVHNRVQTIENMADRLGRLVPRARLAIAHGQMREKDLEDTMMRFLGKEIDVLVCTTIIESGLDIPSANTIFINEADRFGLAQIYQLRGRVGRSEEDAYAYLLLSRGANLSREAEKRLRALMDFSHLGAGMHLAMHDLKIRGGGNILGFSQSGHISAIGYELYVKLIEQSIAELKGEEWQEDINPEINVNLSAYLPAHYISDVDVRLNLYRRLSSLREESELGSITEELHDRFGTPPPEVSNLLKVVSIRLLLKRVRVSRLDITGEGL
ncbi:MAG: transcription-repair coupling factor, partial [Deltaproteobacteria bacterium]|nr:transcription-repair coupling factor [Deltaproteobacteria bacterium]